MIGLLECSFYVDGQVEDFTGLEYGFEGALSRRNDVYVVLLSWKRDKT